MKHSADIGVFGGSGLYCFLEDVEEIKIETPYGPPSDQIALGTYANKKVAFLPRHAKSHSIPPHTINYQANLYAFKSLGIKYVLAPTAAGSLQPNIKPGDIVVVDQFIDRTKGRKDTFYDGPVTTHIVCAEPYSPYLRELAIKSLKKLAINHHESGTVVVIQGPRFSSKAESKWFHDMGWHVINMTQYPEMVLARELEMAYVNMSIITDYDAGIEKDIERISVESMLDTFHSNLGHIKDVLKDMITSIDLAQTDHSHQALNFARFND